MKSKIEWSKSGKCMICHGQIYRIYDYGNTQWLYNIHYFWNDKFQGGLPICPQCSQLVKEMKNYQYGLKWEQNRREKEVKEKIKRCRDCDTKLCNNNYDNCIKLKKGLDKWLES
jgi:hypothetical protein